MSLDINKIMFDLLLTQSFVLILHFMLKGTTETHTHVLTKKNREVIGHKYSELKSINLFKLWLVRLYIEGKCPQSPANPDPLKLHSCETSDVDTGLSTLLLCK